MNVLIALSVTPMGKDEFAPDIAKVVQIIRQSGLKIKRIPCSQKSKANGMM